ncbi:Condensin complex subunit 2, partial [Geodia barretti]
LGKRPGNEGVLGSKNFTVLYQDPLKIQSVQCDELQLTSTLVKSEYSYFDPTTLSTWAGLQHWKIKPVKLKDAKTIKSKRPKCMTINFRASVSSRTFENHQVTSIVSPSVDGSFKSTNLPMDIHLKPNVLHELFIQGKWKDIDCVWCSSLSCDILTMGKNFLVYIMLLIFVRLESRIWIPLLKMTLKIRSCYTMVAVIPLKFQIPLLSM